MLLKKSWLTGFEGHRVEKVNVNVPVNVSEGDISGRVYVRGVVTLFREPQ